jgi:hypothetical protein
LSLDAIVVIAALLTLISVAPPLRRFRAREVVTTGLLLLATTVFVVAMFDVIRRFQSSPRLEQLEERGPQ